MFSKFGKSFVIMGILLLGIALFIIFPYDNWTTTIYRSLVAVFTMSLIFYFTINSRYELVSLTPDDDETNDHIDRETEINTITNYLVNGVSNQDKSNLLWIQGTSGFGKSHLTSKAITDTGLTNYRVIRIQLGTSNEPSGAPYYLRKLYEELLFESESTKSNLTKMVNEFARYRNLVLLLTLFERSINVAFLFFTRINQSVPPIEMFNKISSNLKSEPAIVVFEDFHKVEPSSLEFLKKLIKDNIESRFIVEFTNGYSNLSDYKHCDILSMNRTPFERIDLTKLKLEHILDFYKSSVSVEELVEIENNFKLSNGDMCYFFQLFKAGSNNLTSIIDYDKLTYMKNESSIETLILRIIIGSGGELSYNILSTYIISRMNIAKEKVDNALCNMSNNKVLINKKPRIKVHDTLMKIFSESSNVSKSFMSIECMDFDKYLFNITFEYRANFLCILDLRFQLIRNCFINQILDFFLYLLSLNNKDVKKAILVDVINHINENFDTLKIRDNSLKKNRLIERIIYESYSLGMYSIALDFSNRTEYSSIYIDLTKGILMTLESDFDEFEQYISTMFKVYTNNEYALFILKLTRFTKMLEHLNNDEVYKYAEENILNRNYEQFDEFGIFLRNLSELHSGDKEIDFLIQSLNFHKKRNCKHGAAQTLISLGSAYTRSNQLEKASDTYDEAIKLFDKDVFREHFLLNNYAIVEFYKQGFATNKIINSFTAALSETTDDYERISIYSNLLSCYSSIKDYDAANYYIEELKKTEYIKKYNEYLCFAIVNNICQHLSLVHNEKSIKLLIDEYNTKVQLSTDQSLGKILQAKFLKLAPPFNLNREYSKLYDDSYILSHLGYWEFLIQLDINDYEI